MLLKNKFNGRLNNKSQVPKNKSWIIRNELHELINQSQAVRNNSRVTRNEAKELRNSSQVIRLRNEAQIIKNNSQALKRIQTYDKITTYPYGTNIFKICE